MRLTYLLTFFAALVLSTAGIQAQFKLEDWKVHSSLTNLNTADYDSRGRIWTGGFGGALMYNPETGDMNEFRNLDALLSLEVSAIRCDRSSGLVFAGCFDGVISITNEELKWEHYTEIRSQGFPKSAINDIVFKDNLAYIAGDFGIAVFDTEERIFISQALRLGSFQLNTPVYSLMIENNTIWAAAAEGIARTQLNQINTYPPDSWEIFDRSSGLKNDVIKGIEYFDGNIYVYDAEHLYKMTGDTFEILATHNKDGEVMRGIAVSGGELYYVTNFALKRYTGENIIVNHPALINYFTAGPSGGLVFLYENRGFGFIENNELAYHILPNTPFSNLFTELTVDEKGGLWVSTGYQPGMGLMYKKNGEWDNINQYNYPDIPSNSIINAHSVPGRGLFLGTWGSGLIILNETEGAYSFQQLTNKNSPLTGIADDPEWVITADSDVDQNGLIWTLNYGEDSPGTFFLVQKPGGTMTGIPKYVSSNNRWYRELTIDTWNTKWAASSQSGGLYYYNENYTLDDKSDDIFGILNTSNSSITDNTQNAVETDRQGRIWVGTPKGLCVILNPSAVLNGGEPVIRQIRSIGEQLIKDVMIDALNYVWAATTTGVWILDPEEDLVIASITKDNSPLITNDIESLATFEEDGTVYIGTRSALYQAKSMSAMPLPSFDIFCYPQPFNPERHEELVIEGLAENSHLKITTLDGEFVRTIRSGGRRALWDGRDNKGRLVSTGVYIISASSETTEAGAAGKIAVIRK